MCGIAGFSANTNHGFDARRVAKNLLVEIIARGRDATGMAWTEPNGKVYYLKAPVDARKFIAEGYLDELNPKSKTVILHTRFATKGSRHVEANNHPIVRPGIVGVHNGVIPNDDEVFDLLGCDRIGQVDSEAAFALIAESNMHPTDSLPLLEGRVALAWVNNHDADTLHLARLEGSPLAVGQSVRGTFVFASTLGMLKRAASVSNLRLTMAGNVDDNTYLRVRGGRIHDTLPIGVPSTLDAMIARGF